jgi:hypothetical protein
VDDKAVALSKRFYEVLKPGDLRQLSGRALQD